MRKLWKFHANGGCHSMFRSGHGRKENIFSIISVGILKVSPSFKHKIFLRADS